MQQTLGNLIATPTSELIISSNVTWIQEARGTPDPSSCTKEGGRRRRGREAGWRRAGREGDKVEAGGKKNGRVEAGVKRGDKVEAGVKRGGKVEAGVKRGDRVEAGMKRGGRVEAGVKRGDRVEAGLKRGREASDKARQKNAEVIIVLKCSRIRCRKMEKNRKFSAA